MSKKISCAVSCEMWSVISFLNTKICVQVQFIEKSSYRMVVWLMNRQCISEERANFHDENKSVGLASLPFTSCSR